MYPSECNEENHHYQHYPFFFQAEDGIRYYKVTGVQTCALPISLSPAREEFRQLAATGNLVPVFAELPADLDTPLSAYLRLRPGPYSFLLESVEGGEKWARYSFLRTDPLMVLSAKNGRTTLRRGAAKAERLPDGDPLEALRTLLREFQPVSVPGLPRFQGGAVGFLAYDMVRHMERLPRSTKDDLRSEEHTSELQSPCNLVCRLLLEKKNKPNKTRDGMEANPGQGQNDEGADVHSEQIKLTNPPPQQTFIRMPSPHHHREHYSHAVVD